MVVSLQFTPAQRARHTRSVMAYPRVGCNNYIRVRGLCGLGPVYPRKMGPIHPPNMYSHLAHGLKLLGRFCQPDVLSYTTFSFLQKFTIWAARSTLSPTPLWSM